MNRAEYKNYEERFKAFMAEEKLENLSTRTGDCPACGIEVTGTQCEGCGLDAGEIPVESYFSWRPCTVCRRPEGGDREDCAGYSREENTVKKYDGVCPDCVYYAEYGRLDDTTMAGIEAEPETPAAESETTWEEALEEYEAGQKCPGKGGDLVNLAYMTRKDEDLGVIPFDSIKWIFETVLKEPDTGEYNFAVTHGWNEDSPEVIEFWKEDPKYDTKPDRVWKATE